MSGADAVGRKEQRACWRRGTGFHTLQSVVFAVPKLVSDGLGCARESTSWQTLGQTRLQIRDDLPMRCTLLQKPPHGFKAFKDWLVLIFERFESFGNTCGRGGNSPSRRFACVVVRANPEGLRVAPPHEPASARQRRGVRQSSGAFAAELADVRAKVSPVELLTPVVKAPEDWRTPKPGGRSEVHGEGEFHESELSLRIAPTAFWDFSGADCRVARERPSGVYRSPRSALARRQPRRVLP